jgi:N-acetylneuraminic acid mutarotase
VVFFGGFRGASVSNSIYLYNVDSKIWHCCKGSYQHALKGRYGHAMTYFNDRLYLFGGYSLGSQGSEVLNDFYEIRVRVPTKVTEAQATVRLIASSSRPSPRGNALMVGAGTSDICLLGGQGRGGFDSQIWHFSAALQEWQLAGDFHCRTLNREGSSCVQEGRSIWVFGGLDLE